MHGTAYAFVQRVVDELGPFRFVVEFGSRDVNGTVRPLFPFCDSYVGVDIRPGPGVDVVGDPVTLVFDVAVANVDCVVCTEVMEHTPHPDRLCQTAFDLLHPGGVFIVTAATDPREPHSAIDEQPIRCDEWYHNIDEHDLRLWLHDFDLVRIDLRVPGDIYASAVR